LFDPWILGYKIYKLTREFKAEKLQWYLSQVCFPLRKDWEMDIKFLLITGTKRSERQAKEKTEKTIEATKKPSSHASLVILWIKFCFTEKVLFHCLTLLPNNLLYDKDYKKLPYCGCAFENAFAPTTKIELKYNQRFSKRSGKYPAQMTRQSRALLYSAGLQRTLLKPILQDVSAGHWWLS